MALIKFEDLIDTGAHFGHVTRKWHQNYKQYVLMEKNGVHIINLEETITAFDKAMNFLQGIVKKNGEKKPFDRDKLLRSLNIAVRKRPVTEEQVEITINNIVRELESLGENEIRAEQIGQTVMAALRDLDSVAYVRFASVYKDFTEVKDFGEFVEKLEESA